MKQNWRKKFLAVLMTTAMVFQVMTPIAFAEEDGSSDGAGTTTTEQNSVDDGQVSPPPAQDNPPAPAVDENGDAIGTPPADANAPLDENGNAIAPPTDENGNVVAPQDPPTDEDGNVVAPPTPPESNEALGDEPVAVALDEGEPVAVSSGAYNGEALLVYDFNNGKSSYADDMTYDEFTWDADDKILTILKGETLTINTTATYALRVPKGTTIVLNGDLKAITTEANGIDSESGGNLTISGTGSLETSEISVCNGSINIMGDVEVVAESINTAVHTVDSSKPDAKITIQDNAKVTADTISAYGDVTIGSDATVNAIYIGTYEDFDIANTATVTGICAVVSRGNNAPTATVYGDVVVEDGTIQYVFSNSGSSLSFAEGSSLTINEGITMNMIGLTTITWDNADIINDGTLLFATDTTVDFTKISGSGTITIGDSSYTTDGTIMAEPYTSALTLTAEAAFTDSEKYGFTWTKSEGSEAYDTLTVTDLTINIDTDSDSDVNDALTVPANTTIVLDGNLTIDADESGIRGSIYGGGDLTIEGDGNLTISGNNTGWGIGTYNNLVLNMNGDVEIEAWIAICGDDVIIIGDANWTIKTVCVVSADGDVSIDGGTWTVEEFDYSGYEGGLSCIGIISASKADTIAIKNSKWNIDDEYYTTIGGKNAIEAVSFSSVTGLDTVVSQLHTISEDSETVGNTTTNTWEGYNNSIVYGDVTLSQDFLDYVHMGDRFTFDNGATLTIPSEITLDLNGYSKEEKTEYKDGDQEYTYIQKNTYLAGSINTTGGKLVVNGTVVYPSNTTVDFTKISGSGTIMIGNLQYDTAGTFAGFGGLVFTDASVAEENEFYSWEIVDDADADYILTIKKDMVINAEGINGLTVPMNTNIVLNGDLEINTSGYQENESGYYGVVGSSEMQITGSGTLNINANDAAIKYSGGITITDATVYAATIDVSYFKLDGNATVVSNSIIGNLGAGISGNASVTADRILVLNDFESVETATVNAMVQEMRSTSGSGSDPSNTNNAYTVYGNVTMDESESYGNTTYKTNTFSFHSRCNWTINEGVIIDLTEMDSITWTNANIINNGMIVVAEEYTDTFDFDGFSGDGYIMFTGGDAVVYKSDGTKVNVVDNNDPGGWCLDDEVDEVDEEDGLGYTWLKGEDGVYTLTIDSEIFVLGGLYIDVDDAIIVVNEKLTVLDDICTMGDLTIQGTGTLTAAGIDNEVDDRDDDTVQTYSDLIINANTTLNYGVIWYGDATINDDVDMGQVIISGNLTINGNVTAWVIATSGGDVNINNGATLTVIEIEDTGVGGLILSNTTEPKLNLGTEIAILSPEGAAFVVLDMKEVYMGIITSDGKAPEFVEDVDGDKVLVNAATSFTIGKKVSTGGSSSSGGGSSSSSSSSDTETTTNDDGSVTTTTEDKDGTITEETVYEDGSVEEVVTTTDGTVTTTKTEADGTTVATVEDADGNVTATVTTPDGEDATVLIPTTEEPSSSTVVVIVYEDGTEEIIKDSTATDDGVLATVPDGATVKVVENKKEMSDVNAGDWYAEAVDFVTSREIFSGMGDGTFAADTTMSRAMLMSVLYRLAGASFDAVGEEWYADALGWAIMMGLTDGTNPDADITREQLIAILYRYVGSPEVEGDFSDFVDGDSVSDYAQAAMLWAIQEGLISGNGDGTLDAQGTATRAQVASIMMRFISK